MKIIKTNKAPAALGPYSAGIRLNNGFLFTSGQVPLDPITGNVVSEDVREQAERSLLSIEGILSEESYKMSDVVKTTVFISDMNDFAAINEVYAKHFGDHKPARSCVQVAKLPKNVKLEIEVIAYKG